MLEAAKNPATIIYIIEFIEIKYISFNCTSDIHPDRVPGTTCFKPGTVIQDAILTGRQLKPVPAGAVYYIPVTVPLIANAPPSSSSQIGWCIFENKWKQDMGWRPCNSGCLYLILGTLSLIGVEWSGSLLNTSAVATRNLTGLPIKGCCHAVQTVVIATRRLSWQPDSCRGYLFLQWSTILYSMPRIDELATSFYWVIHGDLWVTSLFLV